LCATRVRSFGRPGTAARASRTPSWQVLPDNNDSCLLRDHTILRSMRFSFLHPRPRLRPHLRTRTKPRPRLRLRGWAGRPGKAGWASRTHSREALYTTLRCPFTVERGVVCSRRVRVRSERRPGPEDACFPLYSACNDRPFAFLYAQVRPSFSSTASHFVPDGSHVQGSNGDVKLKRECRVQRGPAACAPRSRPPRLASHPWRPPR
jgi:hypothetical protein